MNELDLAIFRSLSPFTELILYGKAAHFSIIKNFGLLVNGPASPAPPISTTSSLFIDTLVRQLAPTLDRIVQAARIVWDDGRDRGHPGVDHPGERVDDRRTTGSAMDRPR